MRQEYETINEYRLSLSHYGASIILFAQEDGETVLRVDLRFDSRDFSGSYIQLRETSGHNFNYAIIFIDEDAYERYVDLLRNENPVRVSISWDEEAWSGTPTNAHYEVKAIHLATLDEPIGEEEGF